VGILLGGCLTVKN